MWWSDYRMNARARRLRILPARALAALAAMTLLLPGCGFALRGQATFPFDTLHVSANTPLAVELKRNIRSGSKTRLVDNPKEAQAVLAFTDEARDKQILAINNQGRVREFRLRYVLSFRISDEQGRNLLPVSTLSLYRDISFNDAQVLAKEAEEALLFRDMQTDMVQQLMRRLAAARAAPADEK